MRYFDVPYNHALLKGTIHGVAHPRVFFVHGAADEGSARFEMLRQHLAKVGIASAACDFIGAGQTGGDIVGTTLKDRLNQARSVIDALPMQKPLIIVGASMGADTAVRLTQHYPVSTLILFVPAFYAREAYTAPFKTWFHDAIVKEGGWKDADTWGMLAAFTGSVLVVAAENDEAIPNEIYDMIDASTPNAKYKELYIVPRSPHRILPYLTDHREEFARVFERVYHAIVSVAS
jgi:pimeloyl-ACP methyl ester carboxylesterase